MVAKSLVVDPGIVGKLEGLAGITDFAAAAAAAGHRYVRIAKDVLRRPRELVVDASPVLRADAAAGDRERSTGNKIKRLIAYAVVDRRIVAAAPAGGAATSRPAIGAVITQHAVAAAGLQIDGTAVGDRDGLVACARIGLIGHPLSMLDPCLIVVAAAAVAAAPQFEQTVRAGDVDRLVAGSMDLCRVVVAAGARIHFDHMGGNGLVAIRPDADATTEHAAATVRRVVGAAGLEQDLVAGADGLRTRAVKHDAVALGAGKDAGATGQRQVVAGRDIHRGALDPRAEGAGILQHDVFAGPEIDCASTALNGRA